LPVPLDSKRSVQAKVKTFPVSFALHFFISAVAHILISIFITFGTLFAAFLFLFTLKK
jgi:hypothetical protein